MTITEQKKLVGEEHYRRDLESRPGHTTHHACNEIMERFGGQSYGCCCTGHLCTELRGAEQGEVEEEPSQFPEGSVVKVVFAKKNLSRGFVTLEDVQIPEEAEIVKPLKELHTREDNATH